MSLQQNIEKVAAAIYLADNGGDYNAFINNYGPEHAVVKRYRRLAVAAMDADSRFPGGNMELRTWRWTAKNLGKQLGKAGDKIHQLRGELAAARIVAGVDGRGYFNNLERMRAADTEVLELRARVNGVVKQLEALGVNVTLDGNEPSSNAFGTAEITSTV